MSDTTIADVPVAERQKLSDMLAFAIATERKRLSMGAMTDRPFCNLQQAEAALRKLELLGVVPAEDAVVRCGFMYLGAMQ